MSLISYQDKVTLNPKPDIAEINKVTADNLNEIKNTVNSNSTNTNNNFSEVYSTSKTYNVGDYCIYQDKLYRCITTVATAEVFDSDKWEQVNITNELKKTKTLTLNNEWLITPTAPGGGVRLMIPILNPNKSTPKVDITSGQMYSSSNGWVDITSEISCYAATETFCMLSMSAPFTVNTGSSYLVRLTGTITVE